MGSAHFATDGFPLSEPRFRRCQTGRCAVWRDSLGETYRLTATVPRFDDKSRFKCHCSGGSIQPSSPPPSLLGLNTRASSTNPAPGSSVVR